MDLEFDQDYLQRRFNYADITAETKGEFYIALIVPPLARGPSISLVFDRNVTDLWQMEFGEWHMHFEEQAGISAKVDAAVELGREFISGKKFLVQQLDDAKNVISSHVVASITELKKLYLQTSSLSQQQFGELPMKKTIVWDEYVKCEGGYWERETHARLMKQLKQDEVSLLGLTII